MIEKLEEIRRRFEEVSQLIVQPDIMSDMANYTKLSKEYKDLGKIVDKYEEYEDEFRDVMRAAELPLEKE